MEKAPQNAPLPLMQRPPKAEVAGSNPVGCANPLNELLRRYRYGRTSHGAQQVRNPFGGCSDWGVA